MSIPTGNPMAAVPDAKLEEQYEQQNAGLAQAIREGNLERAKQLQSALEATEKELKARGIHGGSLDPVRP